MLESSAQRANGTQLTVATQRSATNLAGPFSAGRHTRLLCRTLPSAWKRCGRACGNEGGEWRRIVWQPQNLGECRTFFGGSNASRRRGVACCSRELPLMMPCSKSFASIPRCTLGSSRASQATHPPKQMPDRSPFLYHSITPTSRLADPAFAGSVPPYQTTSPQRSLPYIFAICYLSSRRSRVYAPNRPSEAISASQRA